MARFAVDSPSPPPKQSGNTIKVKNFSSGDTLRPTFAVEKASASPAKDISAKQRRRFWFRKLAKQPSVDGLNSPNKSESPAKPRRLWFRKPSKPKSTDNPPMANEISSIIKVEPIERIFVRKFNVDKIPSTRTASHLKRVKSGTRFTVEITILLVVGLALFGYYGGAKEKMFRRGQCDESSSSILFTEELLLDCRQQLFRQDAVIQNLTTILRTHSGMTTMSFIGGCGTGKSFTAKLLTKHFGVDNTQAYNWDEQRSSLEHSATLQDLILDLPSCTNSLVIVDNVAWQHRPYVEDFNRWLQNERRVKGKYFVLIFIFEMDGNDRTDDELEEEHSNGGELKKMNLVKFKSFVEADGREFLAQLKAKRGDNVKDLSDLHLIVRSANVEQYGLKRLASKFLTY